MGNIAHRFFCLFARQAAGKEFKNNWDWIGGKDCLVDNNDMWWFKHNDTLHFSNMLEF